MTLEQNELLIYGHFSDFWGYNSHLGLINFKIGLYIKFNVNSGQKKF